MTHHIYNHFPQRLSLLLGQVDKHITVCVLEKFEGHSEMMVLKDRLIIVHDGQLRAAVDQELVGQAWVVNVMDGRCKDGRHHLQWSENALKQDILKSLTNPLKFY